VYARYRSEAGGNHPRVGSMYVVTRHGTPRRLGQTYDYGTGFLSAPMFVTTNSGGTHVWWWNLRTGRHDSFKLPVGELLAGAYPHGWIVRHDRNKLTMVSASGHRTPLGAMFPNRRWPLSRGIGPTAIVASDRADQIDSIDFASPGEVHHLVTKATPFGGKRAAYCPSVTAKLVTCSTRLEHANDTKRPESVVLASLDSGLVRISHHHCLSTSPAVLGRKASWINCAGHLVVVGRHGPVAVSSHTYGMGLGNGLTLVSAFGAVVAESPGLQALEFVGSTNATPDVIVRTN
jgi:hypothetical protein